MDPNVLLSPFFSRLATFGHQVTELLAPLVGWMASIASSISALVAVACSLCAVHRETRVSVDRNFISTHFSEDFLDSVLFLSISCSSAVCRHCRHQLVGNLLVGRSAARSPFSGVVSFPANRQIEAV